jgi:hypothetical protein
MLELLGLLNLYLENSIGSHKTPRYGFRLPVANYPTESKHYATYDMEQICHCNYRTTLGTELLCTSSQTYQNQPSRIVWDFGHIQPINKDGDLPALLTAYRVTRIGTCVFRACHLPAWRNKYHPHQLQKADHQAIPDFSMLRHKH